MLSNKKEILSIALKLLVICTIVAGIVAFVHTITKDKIELNAKMSTADALSDIYDKKFEVSDTGFSFDGGKCIVKNDANFQCKDISAMYVLTDSNGNVTGYCVAIEPMGFKDVIKMLVAVNDDLTVKQVQIVSMSDTSGIGTKAQDKSFLDKFTGLTGDAAAGVDVISGATKTSQPVINAISNAVKEVEYYKNTTGGSINE